MSFDWTDTEQKQRWSNFPPVAFQRAGLQWGELSEEQQNAWLAVMQAALSTEGYNRVLAEWAADDANAVETGQSDLFGKKYYYIALIGTPSETGPWMWQFGGHHLAVNATIAGGRVSTTPSFIGVPARELHTRPAPPCARSATSRTRRSRWSTRWTRASSGPRSSARRRSIWCSAPARTARRSRPRACRSAQLTAEQRAAALKVIGHYSGLVNDVDAAARRGRDRVRAGPDVLRLVRADDGRERGLLPLHRADPADRVLAAGRGRRAGWRRSRRRAPERRPGGGGGGGDAPAGGTICSATSTTSTASTATRPTSTGPSTPHEVLVAVGGDGAAGRPRIGRARVARRRAPDRRGRPAALRDARRVRAHHPARPHARRAGGTAVRPHRRCRRRRHGLVRRDRRARRGGAVRGDVDGRRSARRPRGDGHGLPAGRAARRGRRNDHPDDDRARRRGRPSARDHRHVRPRDHEHGADERAGPARPDPAGPDRTRRAGAEHDGDAQPGDRRRSGGCGARSGRGRVVDARRPAPPADLAVGAGGAGRRLLPARGAARADTRARQSPARRLPGRRPRHGAPGGRARRHDHPHAHRRGARPGRRGAGGRAVRRARGDRAGADGGGRGRRAGARDPPGAASVGGLPGARGPRGGHGHGHGQPGTVGLRPGRRDCAASQRWACRPGSSPAPRR